MKQTPARISIDICWRPKPSRFIVTFYDATLVIDAEDVRRPRPDYFVPRGSTERRPVKDFGPWRLKDEHENFMSAIAMAEPEALRLERAGA